MGGEGEGRLYHDNRVKINKVPTWCGNNEPISIAMEHEEFCTYVPEYRSMKQWRVPRWLGSDNYICAKNFASIVIDLANNEDRDILLSLKVIKLFNTNCTISPYEERAQVFQCSKCGMFSHQTASCRQLRCLTCASKDHNTDEHPAEEKPKCINCKGDHTSNNKECNTRRNSLGMKPIPVKTNLNQNRPRPKGKNHADPQPLPTSNEGHNDIGLMDEEISSLNNVEKNPQTVKENMAMIIQT